MHTAIPFGCYFCLHSSACRSFHPGFPSELDAPLIAEFLNDLEHNRKNTARSRNMRLTAIRSFFQYASYEAPAHAAHIQRVLAIPRKRYSRKLVKFLERAEIRWWRGQTLGAERFEKGTPAAALGPTAPCEGDLWIGEKATQCPQLFTLQRW
jgi:hypothetical protein